jgi:hypothetical protein
MDQVFSFPGKIPKKGLAIKRILTSPLSMQEERFPEPKPA